MAAKSTASASAILDLILNGIAYAGIADNAAAPYDYLELALHTADPGAGGLQTTSETTYTGYARVQVDRDPDAPAWTGTGASRSNAAGFAWPRCSALPAETVTHFSVGRAGVILYRAPLPAPKLVTRYSVPDVASGAAVITES